MLRTFRGEWRDLIGVNLKTFVDESKVQELSALIQKGALNPLRATTLTLQGSSDLYDAIIHQVGRDRILELEPLHKSYCPLENRDFYQELMRFSVDLQRIDDFQTLHQFLLDSLRRLTGFSRVKLYQFDEQWNGTIIAESKEAYMSSYLGLSFPETDIPKQARILYSKNYLRLIPDIDYKPVPLLPDAEDFPVDLSFATLRSVSAVHLQYMENLGVKATMTISVMQNQHLWGLIACHHHEPYYVPYDTRMAAELFTHTFSALPSQISHSKDLIRQQNKDAEIKEITAAFESSESLIATLQNTHNEIIDAVDADGIVFGLDEKYLAFGLVPEPSFCHELVRWLENNHEKHLFVSNSIERDTGVVEKGKSVASGVLAMPVSTNISDYIKWFRREMESEIHWAGDNTKHVQRDEKGAYLTPRNSFAAWKEKVRGFSKPWSVIDINTAYNLGKLFVTKVFRDKFEQKNENLNSILDSSNAVIYIIDIDGHIASMNKRALAVFGMSAGDVIGEHYASLFEEEFTRLTMESLTKVLETKESTTYEYSFKQNGTVHHLISVVLPLYNSSQDIFATCVVLTDISKLKETELELTGANKELEHMAYIVSHDLQEPLRMIAGFSDLIQKKHFGDFDGESKKYMQFILDGTIRMKNLITGILQYSRLTKDKILEGKISTQKECEKLVASLGACYQDKDATIKIEGSLPEINMLSQHFVCVLQNLVTNSIKYSSDVRVPQVTISCQEELESWLFYVKDNGIGIAEKDFDKIFIIFKRLHSVQEYEGTGIGLALCKRIVEQYGGEIWLESTLGEGSTFFFTVPKVRKVVD